MSPIVRLAVLQARPSPAETCVRDLIVIGRISKGFVEGARR